MSGNTSNPRVWVNADVYVAPVGTAAPTDIVTALNALFVPLGLLSEDGMTESLANSTTDMYAWGGILVRTTKSKHKRTIKVIALEDNKTVWALVNPGSTVSTAATITTRVVKVPQPDKRAFVLVTLDGATTRRRSIPSGEVVDIADVKSSDSSISMFELTIFVYPDGNGVLYTDITNDTQAIVP